MREQTGIGLPALVALVFTVLKLTGFINWSWWWVLFPIWILIVIAIIAIAIWILSMKK